MRIQEYPHYTRYGIFHTLLENTARNTNLLQKFIKKYNFLRCNFLSLTYEKMGIGLYLHCCIAFHSIILMSGFKKEM